MSFQLQTLIANFFAMLILTAISIYLYAQYRHECLAAWTMAWGAYIFEFAFALLYTQAVHSPFWKPIVQAGFGCAALLAPLLMLWGTYLFLGRPMSRVWVLLMGIPFLWALVATSFGLSDKWLALPGAGYVMVIHIVSGVMLYRHAEPSTIESKATGVILILWGVHHFTFPFLVNSFDRVAWGFLINAGLVIIVAVGLLLMYFRNARGALLRTERALRDNQELVQVLLSAPTESACLLDTNGQIIHLNQTAARDLGMKLEKLIGSNIYHLLPPELSLSRRPHLEQARTSGQSCRFEDRWGHKCFDNAIYPIHDERREVVRLALFSHEITERKQIEEELRKANEELRELDQLKNNFLSNVSHELRTPLVGIKGYIELALRRDIPPSRLKEWLEIVWRSCQRLELIINGLLDISGLHSKSIIFEFAPVDLRELLDTAIKAIGPQLDDKSIRVAKEIEPEMNCRVQADPRQLLSVLINLIDNARKFSAVGSTIAVRLASRDAATLIVSVKDQGIGIPRRYHEKIFTRFFQVDSSPTRLYGGSGIGLALVKEIVEAHQGRVWLESAEGEGAAFFFTLPLAPANAATSAFEAVHQERPTVGAAKDGLNVLVMDDDPSVLEFMADLLTLEHCLVQLAGDGARCIELLEKDKFDLLLLDLAMPGLGGVEICRRLKNDGRFDGLPIYIFSARGEESSKQAALDARADGFFQKPFTIEQIRELLARISRNRKSANN